MEELRKERIRGGDRRIKRRKRSRRKSSEG
jgi:hypothetical protein